MVDAECEAKVDPTAIVLFGRSSLRLCLGMLQHVGRRVWLLCRRFLARRRISIGVLLLRWRGTCDVNPLEMWLCMYGRETYNLLLTFFAFAAETVTGVGPVCRTKKLRLRR
jgi:hypothetical protein